MGSFTFCFRASIFFSFFFISLSPVALLQDCIGSIQVNSAMPNRFADCHRLKKGELEKHKRDKENIGFFPLSKIRSYIGIVHFPYIDIVSTH